MVLDAIYSILAHFVVLQVIIFIILIFGLIVLKFMSVCYSMYVSMILPQL